MNMQDKDMDQLFRSKLDSYEVEPSARVWANISNELGAEKQRKSIVPMLRIAASVLVVISAGVFFLTKKQGDVEQPKNPKMVMNPATKKQDVVKPGVVQSVQITPAVNIKPVIVKAQPAQQIASVVNHTKTQRVNISTTVAAIKTSAPVKQDVIDNQQPVLIANNVIDNPVKAGSTAAIPDVQIIEKIVPTVKSDVIASVQPDKMDSQATGKKRKATGLGGFLNKVIAAVDKRDDKIIEFTDTDEGDAITGINLGIIKVKKQK